MTNLQFEFRKFPKIKRLNEEEKEYHKSHHDSLIDCIRKGQIFNISEKLDGTNCGIEIIKTDKDNFQYKLLTHNYYIGDIDTNGNPIEDMRGFKTHAETILIPKLKTWLQDTKQCHIYLYGEWLVSHLVQYQDHMWNHWYLFSIYDALANREYALPDRQMVAEETGLDMPEIFFDSDRPEITPDWLKSYVGKSNDTLDHTDGEGIVVECAGRRAKIRVDQFREVKRIKKPSKPMTPSQKFIAETLTDARAHKMILKFRDENRLPEAIDFNHFGQIAKPLGQALWNDIMEEEADNLPVDFDEKEARKALNKKVPSYVKELIFKTEGKDNNFQL